MKTNFHYKNRFHYEAKSNSEMAYFEMENSLQ